MDENFRKNLLMGFMTSTLSKMSPEELKVASPRAVCAVVYGFVDEVERLENIRQTEQELRSIGAAREMLREIAALPREGKEERLPGVISAFTNLVKTSDAPRLAAILNGFMGVLRGKSSRGEMGIDDQVVADLQAVIAEGIDKAQGDLTNFHAS